MFGFFKKRVMVKMDDLLSAATLSVYALLSERRFKIKDKTLNDADNGQMVGAVSNFLFGHEASQQHLDIFDMDDITKIAYKLLDEDQNFKEYIIQSLRVSFTIINAQSGVASDNLMEILGQYGHEFSESVNPKSYEKLVSQNMERMPTSVKRKLYGDNYQNIIDNLSQFLELQRSGN